MVLGVQSSQNVQFALENNIQKTFVNANQILCSLLLVDKDDSDTIDSYLSLCHEFHYRDFMSKVSNDVAYDETTLFDMKERFEAKLQEKKEEYLNKLNNGQNQLIVIKSANKVVAGSCYELENSGEDVRIQMFSFDRDDKQENQILYSLQIIDYLSQPNQNFPNVQRVTVMVRKTSSEIELLKKAGFEYDENFIAEGYDPNIYYGFVKKIQ